MRWLFLLSFFLFSAPLLAAQNAVVVTEGAIVYKGNSFDAPILGYFSAGKKIRISNKVYGAFYRVRFKQGVIGFISDIDVKVEGQEFQPGIYDKQKGRKSLSRNRPYLGGSYWGLQYASIDFADTVNGVSNSSATSFIGGNFSFPMSFFDGSFTLSISGLYSLETPSLYKQQADNDPSGFVLLGDAQLLYGLYSAMQRKFSVFLGAGFTAHYTDIDYIQSSQQVKVSSATFGGVFSLGAAYRFSNFVVKFEPKYFLEEDSYLGMHLSGMMAF
tara:strand:+ start:9904 stop:10719 length:816 start_codon:yes stop_codon:yes gene_type:complete